LVERLNLIVGLRSDGNAKLGYSNQQLIAAQKRRPEQGRGRVLSWVGLGEQPCY